METSTPKPDSYPQTPFNEIALAVSGGGFRAAAYGLGTMMYLNRLKFDDKTLLERTKFMSSASGGSISVIVYALSLAKEQDFDTFKASLLNFMKGDELLQKALKILDDDNSWTTDLKNRNLINAFAKVYDNAFETATWKSVWDISKKTHLKEVCINASEFQSGQTFRFQNREIGTKNVIGNGLVNLQATAEEVKNLRLGDILAASSCFPVGFEPLVFPDDFAKNNTQKEELYNALKFKGPNGKTIPVKSFGLMDGGITDNQGVESMQLAFDRRSKATSEVKPFDLMIVADVSNRITKPYDTEVSGWDVKSSLKFWHKVLKNSFWVSLSLLVMSSLSILFKVCTTCGLLLLIPSILLTFVTWQYQRLYKKYASKFFNWASETSQLPVPLLASYLQYFTGISIATFSKLISSRLKSAATMSGEIFLKRVRSLNFESFFGDEAYNYRRLSSFIYAMSSAYQRTNAHDEKFKPNAKLQAVAEEARQFGTTLWFTEQDAQKEILKKVIATAQFTLCISLLNYIETLKKEKELFKHLAQKNEIRSLNIMLMNDMKQFETDPYFMVEV